MLSKIESVYQKKFSKLRNIYGLCNELLKLHELNQDVEFATYVAEDKERFSKMFTTSSDVIQLIIIVYRGEARNILFNTALSDEHFLKIFHKMFLICGFISYLENVKKNLWRYPGVNESDIILYTKLFWEKVLSPETLQLFLLNGYDLALLIEKFPEHKKEIEADLYLEKPASEKSIITIYGIFSDNKSTYAPAYNKDKVDKRNNELLRRSVHTNNYSEAIKYLSYGADVSIENRDLVEDACYNGNLEMLQLLEHHGASTNYINKFGYTLLHAACGVKGNICLVQYLLNKNCIDINAKSYPDKGEQYTALDVAIRWGHTEIIEILKHSDALCAIEHTGMIYN